MQANEIIKLFTNRAIVFEDIESKKLECTYGIQLVQKEKSRFDSRHNNLNEHWVVNTALGWGGSLKDENSYRWDITSDAKVVCYRNNYVEFTFFDLVMLSKEEQKTIIAEKKKAELEAVEIAKTINVLTSVLIDQKMAFSEVNNGYLEINYGIHLKKIQRDEYRFIRYKPHNGNQNWVSNQALSWGSNTGWDITTDGKIACCRINYDDYINFEIKILNKMQIEEYKKLNTANPSDAFNKIKMLKKLFDNGLITIREYQAKRAEVLEIREKLTTYVSEYQISL